MIDIRGLPELQRKLDRLNEKVQKVIVKDALRETNEEIVLPAAQAKAPVLTGELKDGLKVKARSGRGIIGSSVFDDEYAGDQFYGAFSELGTGHEPARPFMRPAIDENEQRIMDSVGRKIAHGIDEATR